MDRWLLGAARHVPADVAGRSVCMMGLGGDPPHQGALLSSGAGGPRLIKMQGTGWQAAAAATGRSRQKKAEGMAGVAGGGGLNKRRSLPPTHLPRFGVLIP